MLVLYSRQPAAPSPASSASSLLMHDLALADLISIRQSAGEEAGASGGSAGGCSIWFEQAVQTGGGSAADRHVVQQLRLPLLLPPHLLSPAQLRHLRLPAAAMAGLRRRCLCIRRLLTGCETVGSLPASHRMRGRNAGRSAVSCRSLCRYSTGSGAHCRPHSPSCAHLPPSTGPCCCCPELASSWPALAAAAALPLGAARVCSVHDAQTCSVRDVEVTAC